MNALVAKYRPGVWRYLRILGCGDAEADDLVQEVFLRVLRSGFEERSEPQTHRYLWQTARRLFTQVRHRQSKSPERSWLDAVDVDLESWSADGGEAWLANLRRCLQHLSSRQREAIRLFYGEGRSRSDVAAHLGIRENGVKTLLQRTRSNLRECLERIDD